MLVVKASPVGVDVPIRKLQEYLHGKLLLSWGIGTNTWYSYGRCYRNKKSYGYVPEVYTQDGEYKEVAWDDKLTAISFFGIDQVIKHNLSETTNVHLIFCVNLNTIKGPGRLDEETRLDVLEYAGNTMFGFKYNSIALGVENVFAEYPGLRNDSANLIKFDQHPVHCFRLNFTLNYNKNNCY